MAPSWTVPRQLFFSFDTSHLANTARPPACVIAATVPWPPASFKSATTTAAPSRANNSAIARPMPLPAPVTTADLFFRRIKNFARRKVRGLRESVD